MANTFVKIQTVTVGTAVATIDFTSIPQTYTDLKIVISARGSVAALIENVLISFNSTTTDFTARNLESNGVTVTSSTAVPRYAGIFNGSTSTASIFSNSEIYIPNYTSANYKSFSTDAVIENNAASSGLLFVANLWSNTAAITSVTLTAGSGTFSQYTSATLYGIKSS